MLDNRKRIIDEECLIADSGDAGCFYSQGSAAGTVDGVAKVFDTGGGYTKGDLVIDVASVVGVSGAASNHSIDIILEGSTTSTFAAADIVKFVKFRAVGAWAGGFSATRLGADSTAATPAAGRYIFPFHNDFGGTIYRYLRIYNLVGNPTAAAANLVVKYKAWLSK